MDSFPIRILASYQMVKSLVFSQKEKKKINILYAEKLIIYESIFNYFSIFMSLQKNSENNLKNKNKRPQQCVTKGEKKAFIKHSQLF